MALSEFVAMESAYRALQELDPPARRRALLWLTDALQVTGHLPEIAEGGSPVPAATVPVPAPVPARGGRRRAAAAAESGRVTRTGSGRRARKQAAESAPTDDGQRAYRRMPPAEDVLAAYRQAGTLTGLAAHFGVPRHTVQGWARRLRREGHAIGRNG